MSPHGTSGSKQPPSKTLQVVFSIIAGILLMAWLHDGYAKHKEAAEKAAAAAVVPQAIAQPPQLIKIGKERELHRFDESGCVTVKLHGGWSDFPKAPPMENGKIDFFSLKSGEKVLSDEPGVSSGSSLPAGDYRICRAENSKAWGVEIFQ